MPLKAVKFDRVSLVDVVGIKLPESKSKPAYELLWVFF
jgi:hypothetical protein